MLYKDCIEELTGLEDFIVTDVKNVYGEIHIYGRMAKRIHGCPRCGTKTSKVHDYREQIVKDVSGFGQRTYLHLRKRRHVCPNCKKRFYETTDFLSRYQRMTKRLICSILEEFHTVQSMKQIGKRCNISASTVARVFDFVTYGTPVLPKVLSIDEFRGNAEGEKYQCILTDPKDKRVLDILPNRKAEDLYRYFSGFPERKDVCYVSMDMSTLFRSVVKRSFPRAKIVVDRFHLVRNVCWALERVRKEEQKKFGPDRRKYFKRSKTLLLKHYEALTEEQMQQLALLLSASERIRRAYFALQDFYQLMEEPDRYHAKRHLAAWLMRVESYGLPEFHACTVSIRDWLEEILNTFDVPYSNGFTEGTNNKIKVLKRVSYGVRNFSRSRSRILTMMSD